MMIETFNPSFRKTLKRYLRDLKNILLYRKLAPLTHQLIYLDPNQINVTLARYKNYSFRRKHSALVLSGNWDKSVRPINETPKIKACMLRFRDNKSWEDSGMYELMMDRISKSGSHDQCKTIEDVKSRYARIDRLFEKVKADQKLLPRKQLIPNNHREFNGIFVHIDRNGDPIFTGSGCHRLAMARALNLPKIPCELGVVHKGALKTEKYRDLIRCGEV